MAPTVLPPRLNIASSQQASGKGFQIFQDEGFRQQAGHKTCGNWSKAFQACEIGDIALLKFFLDHGGDATALNELGDTLLHACVRGGNVPTVRLLLERGVSVVTKNAILDTPLQIAMKRNDHELSLLLMQHAKKESKLASAPRKVLRDVSNTASENGLVGRSGTCGNGGKEVRGANGETASVAENSSGDFHLCANCEQHVPKANSAMHEAMCYRRFFRCPFCSVSIESKDREAHLYVDADAMFKAVEEGDVDRLQYLVTHGGDLLSAREVNSGHTLLHKAVVKCDIALVTWLVEKGLPLTATNNMNDTPLQLAFRGRNEEILMFLTLALSEEDTGSETTAAIALSMPADGAQKWSLNAQDRALQTLFEIEEQRARATAGDGPRDRNRLLRHNALAHMSPVLARARDVHADSEDYEDGSDTEDDGSSQDDTDDVQGSADLVIEGKGMHVDMSEAHSAHIWAEARRLCEEIDAKNDARSTTRSINVKASEETKRFAIEAGQRRRRRNAEDESTKGVPSQRRDSIGGSPDSSQEGTPLFQRYGCGGRTGDDDEGGDDEDDYEVEGGWEDEQCLKDFFAAVAEGNVHRVRASLDRWALEGNESDHEGNRALHIAARHGHTLVIRELLERGFDLTDTNRQGQTPDECARDAGNIDLADHLRAIFNHVTGNAPTEPKAKANSNDVPNTTNESKGTASSTSRHCIPQPPPSAPQKSATMRPTPPGISNSEHQEVVKQPKTPPRQEGGRPQGGQARFRGRRVGL